MTAQEYLTQHGISESTVKLFELTSDDNYLHIPVKDEQGNYLFTKSRNLKYTKDSKEPKYKNAQNSHATLFNLHAVKDEPNIVLCEGEIDCMRLIQAGIPSVSSTGGANTFLKEWVPFFENKTVLICFDNDEAGKKGLRSTLELIPHARVISLPKDTKDICEFFEKYSKKEFAQLMRDSLTKDEWETSNLPEDFSYMPLSDIVTIDFPEQPWLIDNILYNEGFCFIYGAEGTGKSFLALSIAQAVATGSNWLNHFHTPKPVNVLVLDKENPLSMVAKRAKGLGMNASNIFYLTYPEKFSLVNSKGEYSDFALALNTISNKENIGLVIIDSFVDFMLGSENSAQDTQAFFNALRELFPNRAFVALHHENKPSQGVFRNDSQRLRGSSNVNAQTFTAFRLETVAKSKTEMTIKQVKARDSLKLDKFMIRMSIERANDGNTVVRGFEYLGVIVDGEDESKLDETKSVIAEVVGMQKAIKRKELIEIIESKGISETTARRVIKEMLDKGSINESKTGKDKWYSTGIFIDEEDPTETFDGSVL